MSAVPSHAIDSIVAAGSGRMGIGMAIAFAYAGRDIHLLDLKKRDASSSLLHRESVWNEINAHLASLQRIGAIGSSDIDPIANRIRWHPRTDFAEVLADADLVLEGVPERLEDKREAFQLIESGVSNSCVLASTTSSFLADTLANELSRPQNFLNAHWLNPAYVIPLVELSPHAGTDSTVTESVQQLLESIGKVPVLCKPSPGYIVPRLQALVMNEAARLVQEGVASAKDVDRAVRLGFGMRYASMGLLEFVDFGGLDILYYASGYMSRTVDEHRYETPEIVEQKMKAGDIGVRTGKGLYDWSGIDVPEYRDQTVSRLVGLLRSEGLFKPPVID